MNLDEFNLGVAHEEGADIVIKHPVTGKDTDIVITVVGKESATYRNTDKMLRAKYKDKAMSDEEWTTAYGAELLASCVRSWKGLEVDGKDMAYSKEFAVKIFSDPSYDSFAGQIISAISNRDNFYKKKVIS